MFLFKVLLTAGFVLIPALAMAWGPLTHVYLGSEILQFGAPLIPAAVYELIRRYREDFLYGNVMADLTIGKSYMSKERNAHNWEPAFRMYDDAASKHEQAFALGYLSHLAADTVAHGDYLTDKPRLGHVLLEFSADNSLDRKYWQTALGIRRKVQKRNDLVLAKYSPDFVVSFGTSKKLFKSWVVLSGLPHRQISKGMEWGLGRLQNITADIPALHSDSLDRVADILTNVHSSHVATLDPNFQEPRKKTFISRLIP